MTGPGDGVDLSAVDPAKMSNMEALGALASRLLPSRSESGMAQLQTAMAEIKGSGWVF